MNKEVSGGTDWGAEIHNFILSTGDFTEIPNSVSNRKVYKTNYGAYLLIEYITDGYGNWMRSVFLHDYVPANDDTKAIYEFADFPKSAVATVTFHYDKGKVISQDVGGTGIYGACSALLLSSVSSNKLFLNYSENELSIITIEDYSDVSKSHSSFLCLGKMDVDNYGGSPFAMFYPRYYNRSISPLTGEPEDVLGVVDTAGTIMWLDADYVDNIEHLKVSTDIELHIEVGTQEESGSSISPPEVSPTFSGNLTKFRSLHNRIEVVNVNSMKFTDKLSDSFPASLSYRNSCLPDDKYTELSTNKGGLTCNTLNGETMLMPINIYVRRDPLAAQIYSFVGSFKTIYFTNLYNCANGDSILSDWGSDDKQRYRLFLFNPRRSFQYWKGDPNKLETGNYTLNSNESFGKYCGYMGYAIKL